MTLTTDSEFNATWIGLGIGFGRPANWYYIFKHLVDKSAVKAVYINALDLDSFATSQVETERYFVAFTRWSDFFEIYRDSGRNIVFMTKWIFARLFPLFANRSDLKIMLYRALIPDFGRGEGVTLIEPTVLQQHYFQPQFFYLKKLIKLARTHDIPVILGLTATASGVRSRREFAKFTLHCARLKVRCMTNDGVMPDHAFAEDGRHLLREKGFENQYMRHIDESVRWQLSLPK